MLRSDQLELSNGKIITFNSQQVEGLEKISKWLKEPTGNFFCLAGYAGTGKSSIIKKLFETYKYSICVSAPTHTAKKIIIRTTGQHGETLHHLLGLRVDVNLDFFLPNFPEFAPIAEIKINNYRLVVVDECSMINSGLLALIKSSVLDRRTKILFVGDSAQVPPVGEMRSEIFFDDTIEKHQLTKVERQQDSNPLMPIYDSLRNNLDDLYGGFERISNMNENGEGVIYHRDKRGFREAVINKFTSEEAKKDSDYIKLIAWTNDAVLKSNQTIRTAIFGENSDVVELNDVLVGYRTISDETAKFNIIENSADYRVIKKSGLEENQYNIKGYRLTLSEKIDYNTFTKTNIFLVDSNDYDNLHEYAMMHDFFRDMAVNNKKLWKKYYEFRRKTMICINVDTFKNGTKRGKQDFIKMDISYGFCITCHKAQGATYQNVAILETDINNNWILSERNRLLYTAMTRPTTSAIILTSIN